MSQSNVLRGAVDLVGAQTFVSQVRSRMPFYLAFGPGLLGLFGLGHLYLGRKRRGLVFLGYSAALYSLVALSFLLPVVATIPLPPVWGVGWVAQLYDVLRLQRSQVPARTQVRAA